MKKITIEIETTNDAFQGDWKELACILWELGDNLDNSQCPPETIKDMNGNTVGKVIIKW